MRSQEIAAWTLLRWLAHLTKSEDAADASCHSLDCDVSAADGVAACHHKRSKVPGIRIKVVA